jgi:hypothetical protein
MAFLKVKDVDQDINRFKKTNLLYETDKFRMYQDPTVWSFKIMFHGINTNAVGLLNENVDIDGTAAQYLSRIGEKPRLEYLKGFTNMLQKINLESPWYFQSITGLGDAWKRDFNKPWSPGVLTIGCLESVDFKMTTMIDMYRKACFDWNGKSEVVPKNLREFEMWIYVYEGRRFKWAQNDLISDVKERGGEIKSAASSFKEDPLGNAKSIANSIFVGSTDEDWEIQKTNHFMFRFSNCEFDLSSGSGAFDSATNAGDGTAITQSIVINYGNCEESNLNTMFGPLESGAGAYISDYLLGSLELSSFDYNPDGDTSGQSTGLDAVKDAAGAMLKKLANNAAQGAIAAGINKVQSKLQGLLLGNVYGFSPANVLNNIQSIAGDPQSILNGSASLGGGGASTKNNQKYDIDKIIEDGASIANSQKKSIDDVIEKGASLSNKQQESPESQVSSGSSLLNSQDDDISGNIFE